MIDGKEVTGLVFIRYWDAQFRPVNHDPRNLVPTQELPPFYVENSCIYIFTRNSFTKHQNRIGDRPFLFEIDPMEAVDIDTMQQFLIAEYCYKTVSPPRQKG